MTKRKLIRYLGMLLCALSSHSVTNAAWQDEKAPAEDLIHSDLPLYGDETRDKWPLAFDGGSDIGCSSRVSFGDWRFRQSGDDDEADDSWYRIRNYGAFHCYALVASAYARDELSRADSEYSFFVLIGESGSGDSPVELWALQMGGRPGSDYLLLARQPGQGLVTAFDVLQRECPKQHLRDAGSIDILSTRYCAINSKADLLGLARSMARLKPLGILTREGDTPEDEGGRRCQGIGACSLRHHRKL